MERDAMHPEPVQGRNQGSPAEPSWSEIASARRNARVLDDFARVSGLARRAGHQQSTAVAVGKKE
jgi:hypothetical protein